MQSLESIRIDIANTNNTVLYDIQSTLYAAMIDVYIIQS